MQFPESWLREFCNPALSTSELADVLTMSGLEVEEIKAVAPPFSLVVVGEIKEVAPHPNADRLRVCQVDVGTSTCLNIVCGAPNARVGIKVPCALVGAQLPTSGGDAAAKPFVIKLGQLRGVESAGMLCSAKELGISDAASGLLELDASAMVGQNIREHLQLDDSLLTLKLTPNLAHCLSVYGVARELSAMTGAPLKAPAFTKCPVDFDDTLPVKLEASDLCGRFSGRIVRGVNARAVTPRWMVDKLERCGQRSISPLVDISNFVMFELGRPSHIFDLAKIKGGLQVRWAKAGEQLKLLNGQTMQLHSAQGLAVGVIADDAGVESLAGIMGGDHTAVSDDTQDIYIETAFWHPRAVVGRSRQFNFSTDAGHRFERGVDPSTTVEHLERITQLVQQICGGRAGAVDDQSPSVPVAKGVDLRVARAVKVIGMPITADQCMQALQGLGLSPSLISTANEPAVLRVQPPSYRFDLQIEEDLIEEIARTIGYQNLPTTKPNAPITPKLMLESKRSGSQLRRMIAALGYQETINFSFVPEQWELDLAGNHNPIRLLNPIASQMNVMRSSLIGSLLAVMKYNQDRKMSDVRVFELGRVFMRDSQVVGGDASVQGMAQPLRLAALAAGHAKPVQWGSPAVELDFYDVKADVEQLFSPRSLKFEACQHPALHPGRSARVSVKTDSAANGVPGQDLGTWQEVGFVGELHPKWKQSYGLNGSPVLFELDFAALQYHALPKPNVIPKVPFVQRDLALVLAQAVTHDQVMTVIDAVRATGTQAQALKDATLFDVYLPKPGDTHLPEGHKSVAVRLTLGDDEHTLTDAQIEATVQLVLNALTQKLNARLR